MGDPYTDVTVLNYNDDAPADDGTAVPSNQVKWSTVKNEVGDPLKTGIESLNTNIGAAVDKLAGGVNAQTSPYTVQTSDQGKIVPITSAGTVTLPAAATAASPFKVAIVNTSTGTVTIDGNASETIDGAANITLAPGEGVDLQTDGSNWNTHGQSAALPIGYIGGLEVTINGVDSEHDIDIAVGEARDTTDAANLEITSTFTKRIDANWAAGTGNGGFPSGISLTADTWYHVFLVDDGSSGVDAGFDSSVTATNLLSDSGGSQYVRIASVLTDSSSNISIIIQHDAKQFLAEPQATTSGTEFDFFSILPTGLGLAIRKVDIYLDQVSLSGGDNILVQIGDSGGIEATGYVSASTSTSSTTGFVVQFGGASQEYICVMTLHNVDSANKWLSTHSAINVPGGITVRNGNGVKTLSDALERIKLTRTGSNTFDNGEVNVRVEFE